jgi:hypothetical protein
MQTTSFTNGIYKFTDGEFISPSVPMDNLYLPIVNWLTIATDGTDGQCFGGLPWKYHSTETALLKVQSDILLSMDRQEVCFLVLLDSVRYN